MQALAFPIEEILQNDVNDEENKLIVEFFKNVEKENKELPATVCSRKPIEKVEGGKMHSLCLIMNDYNKNNALCIKENAVFGTLWQNYVVSYLTDLRKFIHRKYNRKVINEDMYERCNCSIFSSLKRKEHLIEIFQTQPICLHLYLYGINYKQIVFYIEVITQYITTMYTWNGLVELDITSESNETSFVLYLWIIYFLILLDYLQALDSDVASNLQVIKRYCLKKLENSTDSCEFQNSAMWDDLINFHCKSDKTHREILPSNCPTTLFYVIYLMITKIFNQK